MASHFLKVYNSIVGRTSITSTSSLKVGFVKKWGWKDLNLQPKDTNPLLYPIELHPQTCDGLKARRSGNSSRATFFTLASLEYHFKGFCKN